jgi:hypothetical protein
VLRRYPPGVLDDDRRQRLSPGDLDVIFTYVLDRIYPVPRRYDTLEDDERYEHRDLAHLSRAELLREQFRMQIRLALDNRPCAWLLARPGRIDEALRCVR